MLIKDLEDVDLSARNVIILKNKRNAPVKGSHIINDGQRNLCDISSYYLLFKEMNPKLKIFDRIHHDLLTLIWRKPRLAPNQWEKLKAELYKELELIEQEILDNKLIGLIDRYPNILPLK